MDNCLVTKLKGTVDNDTLRRFNIITLRANTKTSETLQSFRFRARVNSNKTVTVTPIQGHIYRDSGFTNRITEPFTYNSSEDIDLYFNPQLQEIVEFSLNNVYDGFFTFGTGFPITVISSADNMAYRATGADAILFYNKSIRGIFLNSLGYSGNVEDIIEKVSPLWAATSYTYAPFYKSYFGGKSKFNNNLLYNTTLYCQKDNDTNIVSVYNNKAENAFAEADLIATYNINTKTWTYIS